MQSNDFRGTIDNNIDNNILFIKVFLEKSLNYIFHLKM